MAYQINFINMERAEDSLRIWQEIEERVRRGLAIQYIGRKSNR